jgi:carbon-monoxide dehydrogenase medium subunit
VIFQPETIEEALGLLANSDQQLVVVSGGTDVLPAIRSGKYASCSFLDISHLKGLSFCYQDQDFLYLGPSLTHTQVLEHELIGSEVPLLCAACSSIGSPQIRNLGTLGGNLITLASCADSVPALLTLRANLTFISNRGSRTITLSEYLRSPVCEPAELLTSIAIPLLPGSGWVFYHKKISRRQAASKSRMSIALLARMDAGRFASCTLACGAITSIPRLFPSVGALVEGEIPSEELGRQAGLLATQEISESAAVRQSYRYKLPVLQELVKRAIVSCGSPS